MTTPERTQILRIEAIPGANMTNIVVPGLNITEVTVTVPNAVLNTDAMWQMIELALRGQEDTHKLVNEVF